MIGSGLSGFDFSGLGLRVSIGDSFALDLSFSSQDVLVNVSFGGLLLTETLSSSGEGTVEVFLHLCQGLIAVDGFHFGDQRAFAIE